MQVKKGIQWFKKYENWFKWIFIVLMTTFVIFEVRNVTKKLDLPLLKKSLTSQSNSSIILMLLAGLLTILPMLGSDIVIVQLLRQPFSKAYIFINGWVTNSFANIAGIGGLISAPLRAHFYGKNVPGGKLAIAVSKTEMFLLSGFSIQGMLALIVLFIPNYLADLHHYWPLALISAGIFPVLYLTTRWRTKFYFSDFSSKQQLVLFTGSSLGWWMTFVTFFLIGHSLGVHASFSKVFVVFVIGTAIGMFSLLPGGLGTFDLFVLYGLGTLGVAKEVGIVWILFFRFFAYVVPFLIGFVLFIVSLFIGKQKDKLSE